MATNYDDVVKGLASKTNPDGSRKYTDQQVKDIAESELNRGNIVKEPGLVGKAVGAIKDAYKSVTENPEFQAAGHSYLQGASLGTFDPAMAAVIALNKEAPGETYEERYANALKHVRGLSEQQKAEHPYMAALGGAASYVGPTGAGALFKAGTKIGTKALAKAGTGTTMKYFARPAAQTAAGLALPAAAQGFVEGTSDEGLVGGLEKAGKEGATAAATGAVVGPAFHGIGQVLQKSISSGGSKLTGTEYEALREWAVGVSKGGKQMSKLANEAVKKHPEIASDMAKMARSGADIPEYEVAIQALRRISSPIPSGKVEREFRLGIEKGKMLGPKHEGEVKLLEKWQSEYLPKYQSPTQISKGKIQIRPIAPEAAEALKKALQSDVNYARLSQDTPYYDKVMKSVAANLRESIRSRPVPEAAEYGKAMDVAASKMEALGAMRGELGKKMEKLASNAEKFLKRAAYVEGKPNYEMQVLLDVDKAFGKQFAEIAEGLSLARKLGPSSGKVSATPQAVNVYRTGATLAGPALAGMAMGGSQGAGGIIPGGLGGLVIGVAASSPRLWAEGIRAGTTLGKLGAGRVAPAMVNTAVSRMLDKMMESMDAQPPDVQATLKLRQAGTISDEMAMRLITNKNKTPQTQTLGQVGR